MAKLKPVNYKMIEQAEDPCLYKLVADLVQKHHPDLEGAAFVLYWKSRWKPDPDGNLTLARLVKPNDQARELREHDFALWLNHDYWREHGLDERAAWIDNELARAVRVRNKEDGEAVQDVAGRPVYRLRRYTLQLFDVVARRHPVLRRSFEAIAEAGSYVDLALAGAAP